MATAKNESGSSVAKVSKRYNDANNQRKRDREQWEIQARAKAAELSASVADVGPTMTVNSMSTAPPACRPLGAR